MRLRRKKGVDDFDSAVFEVANIACRNGVTALSRDRGYLSIEHAQRLSKLSAAPHNLTANAGSSLIEVEHAMSESFGDELFELLSQNRTTTPIREYS